jgi:hypothetical protein
MERQISSLATQSLNISRHTYIVHVPVSAYQPCYRTSQYALSVIFRIAYNGLVGISFVCSAFF